VPPPGRAGPGCLVPAAGAGVIRLNLGCGARPEPGWVNLDVVRLPGVDVVHDLDVLPWPFADGAAVQVKGEDVFEHVSDPLGFMAECHRVLVPGGSLYLRTSYWQSENAYSDPTHQRFCTTRTFDYWCVGTEFHERYGAAYARGCTFEKTDVHVHDQELVVHLTRL
jgi:SAM-dependent methyltransferase